MRNCGTEVLLKNPFVAAELQRDPLGSLSTVNRGASSPLHSNRVVVMGKTKRTAQGFTLIEIAVVVALAGMIIAISIPRMTAWRAKMDARAEARAVADILNAARTGAIRTSTQYIVYLRVPGVGTTDPNATDLVNAAGTAVDILTLEDSDGDCLIDTGEPRTFLTFDADVEFGLTNATVKVPNDTSTAALATGATFANPESTATAVRWIMFRPDGVPVGFSGDPTGCDTVGATGSGAGGIYLTNGIDDFAPVLSALGGVRLHLFDIAANGWTS